MPWSSVLTGPKLGLGMLKSAKVTGICPLTCMAVALRLAVTVNSTGLVVPRKLMLPAALAVMVTPSVGTDPRSIGDVRVKVAVG